VPKCKRLKIRVSIFLHTGLLGVTGRREINPLGRPDGQIAMASAMIESNAI
jgi:hypothetical protein